MNYSERLKELRIEKGLTQKEMASKLDVSTTGYAGWEQGKREPSISFIIKICEFFGVTTDYFLGVEE